MKNTVHVVSAHYVNAAGELASFVAHEAAVTSSAASAAAGTSSTVIILTALSPSSLALTAAAIAAGTAIVYKRHRQAQALLTAHAQGSAAHDVELILLGPRIVLLLLHVSDALDDVVYL